ncbi:M13 family metallopeptidase [Photobacterium sp. TY1-4]|uniref:M13 family metallopeptidase n=1 Tax=Photobacterium sp. TY1-4 TaxID=2899122 RepID=UPI0021BEC806|nr:M13 family metallopeptidase [Photobacterium sp. TY1-4]UXI03888.1 M13 family metallopeptidase [Photobacterium sp. TY1-4]
MQTIVWHQLVRSILILLWLVAAGAQAKPEPQQDYYHFANAAWLDNTPIPEDMPGVDNFVQLTLKVNALVRESLEALEQRKTPLTAYEQQLLDLYHSYLDTDRRNQLGITPLVPELKLIADAKDHQQLAGVFAAFQRQGIGVPLVMAVMPDPKQSTRHVLGVVQYGLGQSQAVLVGEDDRSKKIRELYQTHIAKMLSLAGITGAAEKAPQVLTLEQQLARIQWTPAQNRDPRKKYNPFTLAQLQQTLSTFPVQAMMSDLGVASVEGVVVQQPSYLEALNALFPSTKVAVWQDYLRMRLLAERGPLLTQDFQDELNRYQRALGGSQKEMPQWLRAVLFLGESVDMLVGRVYIEQQFSREALAQVNHIVQTIKEEYSMAIEGSTLFSDATKAEALAKLKNMRFYVGYPEVWKDYSTLKVAPDDLVGNARAIARFDHESMVAKLSQPVDPDEWLQSPTVVNAYYQPSANKFILLAAILQPPFFDAAWDDAAQFGGIGFIIGHEIGHGFDDQGSQFDAEGNLRNWWTAADRKKFNAVAARAVAQANAYEILPGHFLNGELELGEILGDLNGLHIAYRAHRRIMSTEQDPQQADRTFFEQAAKVWRSNLRQPILLKFLETDGHPPGEYRVNGIFPHLDAFHTLYQTQVGDGMYLAPKDRLKIW